MYKGENWLTVPPIKLGSGLGGIAGVCPVHVIVSCSVLPLGQSSFSEPLPRPFPSDPQVGASIVTPFSGRAPLFARVERSLIHPWAAGLV